MPNSMTGFAAVDGSENGLSWSWEIRGVNARGLDLRLRLPDKAQAMEAELRRRLSAHVKRGAVHVALKLKTETQAAAQAPDIDALNQAAAAVALARTALEAQGVTVGPTDPAALLTLPGVSSDSDAAPLPNTEILAGFDQAITGFVDMRQREGAALAEITAGQLDALEALVTDAKARLVIRQSGQADRYRNQVAELVEAAGQALDPDRLSHDLAALTVKGDVSEEIDRLGAHIASARALLTETGPLGRKLDFLTQEFNREANTLCAKSSDTELTRIGLDLKVVIDQMREQVQNLE